MRPSGIKRIYAHSVRLKSKKEKQNVYDFTFYIYGVYFIVRGGGGGP